MSSNSIYSCIECAKTFSTLSGLSGHSRMHGRSNGTVAYPNNVCCIYTRKVIRTQKLNEYQETLLGTFCEIHKCENCNNLISIDLRFCSKSCQASLTNKRRGKRSEETKRKISSSVISQRKERTEKLPDKVIKDTPIKIKKQKEEKIVGPFSRILHCTCKHCGVLTLSRITKNIVIYVQIYTVLMLAIDLNLPLMFLNTLIYSILNY